MFIFQMPRSLRKTGLKIVTESQIKMMEALFNRDESIVPCVMDKCFTYVMKWYMGAGYAVANFHVQDEIPGNRFVYLSYEASPPEDFDSSYYCIDDLVRRIEESYQIHESLSIWSSLDKDDLGYDPESPHDDFNYHFLVPLTKGTVERLPLHRRIDAFMESYDISLPAGEYHISRLAYTWNIPQSEVSELFYGFSEDWKIKVYWKAKSGDEKAKAALIAIIGEQ